MSAQDSKRAETAKKIMKALSRPGTAQSRSASAWNGDNNANKAIDPEKGIRPKTAASEFNDPFLEEELASEEKYKGNNKDDDGPQGCWTKVSKYVGELW